MLKSAAITSSLPDQMFKDKRDMSPVDLELDELEVLKRYDTMLRLLVTTGTSENFKII